MGSPLADSLFPTMQQPDMKVASRSIAPKTKAGAPAHFMPVLAVDPTPPWQYAFRTDDQFFFGLPRQPHGPLTPSASDLNDYVFNEEYTDKLRALAAGEMLFIIGPPGAGKTMTPRWFAHHWGVPYTSRNHDAHVQSQDLLSQPTQDENGIWHDVPSMLLQHYEHGGVYVAEELPSLRPAVAQVYHPFLNGDSITVKTQTGYRVIKKHPYFRFVATGNHWATQGNYEIGEALLSRCITFTMGYLPPDVEIAILERDAPSFPRGLLRDLVAFANQVRAGVINNPDNNHYVPDTRTLRRIARFVERGYGSIDQAIETDILGLVKLRYPDEYTGIETILQAHVALERWTI